MGARRIERPHWRVEAVTLAGVVRRPRGKSVLMAESGIGSWASSPGSAVAAAWRLFAHEAGREIADLNDVPFAKRAGAFDGVLQFANVAGPIVGTEVSMA